MVFRIVTLHFKINFLYQIKLNSAIISFNFSSFETSFEIAIVAAPLLPYEPKKMEEKS